MRFEALEPRQLLTLDVPLVLGTPDDDFGAMERAIARAADLSRYSDDQLADADRWVVINPALAEPNDTTLPDLDMDGWLWQSASDATAGASLHSAPATQTTTPLTSTSTPIQWPVTPPASVLEVTPLPDLSTDFEIWRFDQDAPWDSIASELSTSVGAGHFYPLVPHARQKKFVPNDPFFQDQWHLQNRGQSGGLISVDADVVPAWDTVRGRGVVIGIVDDGLQYTHPDLAANYRADLSRDIIGNDNDPAPVDLFSDAHGTSAAGVAAARGNNAIGVSGAAPEAGLAGLRLLGDGQDDAAEAAALSHRRNDIHIYSNSWGPVDGIDYLSAPEPLTLQAIRNGVNNGRNGRGNIFTFAAGNGLEYRDDVNYDGYANSRYTIAVSAIDHNGRQASYSEPGAPILIAAPSSNSISSEGSNCDFWYVGVTTTDLVGQDGTNYSENFCDPLLNLDYESSFGGTSSATPLVSGVIALMLEANPNLTWRDVQHVLVNSAWRNDPFDSDWMVNGAGFHVNHKYGFGAIDAAAAVSLARSWPTIGPANTGTTGLINVNRLIPDNNFAGITSTVNVPNNLGSIEHVEIVLTTNHSYSGDLRIELTSPAGTRSDLAEPHQDDTRTDYAQWTFTTVRHWGESTNGAWTLHITDEGAIDEGVLASWQINFYTGPAPAPVAVADHAVTRAGTAISIDVLENDTGQLDPTRVRVTTPPRNGTATVSPTTGVITYTPRSGFLGDDAFQYVVANLRGEESAPATVTIAVTEPPTLRDDAATVAEDNTVSVDVLANDTDSDGTIDRSSLEIITAPTNGTATIDAQGRIAYVPKADFFGTDRFVYRARDDDGLMSTATVLISVTGVNDLPVANNDEFSATVGGTTRLAVLANDVDIDSNLAASSLEIVSAPATGTAVVDTVTGEILYTAGFTFRGGETLTYRVRDTQGALSNTATVRLERSTSPTALDDAVTTLEDFPILLDLVHNDFDIDGHIVRSSIQIVSPPLHGRAIISPSVGLVTYRPDADYVGPDSFRYTVRDNAGFASNVATVHLTLENVDDGPRLNRDTAGTAMDAEVRIDVLANDHDIDSAINPETVLIPLGGQPRHGQVTIKPTTGAIDYIPDAGYQGGDRFTYFVRDEGGTLSNEGVVHVRVGEPVRLSGRIFVDLSNNGLPDPGESGIASVQVQAIFDNGQYRTTATVNSGPDGAFHFIDNPAAGVILPMGTYTLVQTHPAAFIDGTDTPGAPSALVVTNDRFTGLTLAAGEAATNFYFAERGLRAAFVPAFLSRRLYLASSAAGFVQRLSRSEREVLDLTAGEYWYTIDQSWNGELAVAVETLDGGQVQVELFDAGLRRVATGETDGHGASLRFRPAAAGPYFMKVYGAGQASIVSATLDERANRLPAIVSFGGTQWAVPLAQGDSSLEPPIVSSGAPVSPPSAAHLSTLPWSNVNEISVRFTDDVVVHWNSLVLRSLSGRGYDLAAFGYDPNSFTATWTLAQPLADDKYLIDLRAMTSEIDLSAGADEPGLYRFSVLTGDATGDGRTTIRDAIAVRNHLGSFYQDAGYAPQYDLDRDGHVSATDLGLAMQSLFHRLPIDEISGNEWATVSPPVPAPAAAIAVSPTTAPRPSPVSAALHATRRSFAPEPRGPEARGPEARAPEARAPEARAPEARAVDTVLAEPIASDPSSTTIAASRRVRRIAAPARTSLDPVLADLNS